MSAPDGGRPYYVVDTRGICVVDDLPTKAAAEQLATLLQSIWQEEQELAYIERVARGRG